MNSHKNLLNDTISFIRMAVMLNRDLRLTNRDPMEVGTTYSWRYWLAARMLAEQRQSHLARDNDGGDDSDGAEEEEEEALAKDVFI